MQTELKSFPNMLENVYLGEMLHYFYQQIETDPKTVRNVNGVSGRKEK